MSLAHNGVLFLDELPGVPEERPGGPQATSGRRGGRAGPGPDLSAVPFPVCSGGGHESMSVRVFRGRDQSLHLRSLSGYPLPQPGFGSTPGPDRPPRAGAQGASSGLGPGEAGGREPAIRRRVCEARSKQSQRFRARDGIYSNGQMGPTEIRRFCRASADVTGLLQRAMDRLTLSARAYHRILKVARTVADLDGSADIAVKHVAEAIQYRSLDRASPL